MTEETKPDQSVLATAKSRFEAAQTYFSPEYHRGEEDVNFLLGDQWPANVRAKRQSQDRPCLVENQLMPFAHQVINDIRQTRPAIKVSPVDDKADVETADVMKGMIRNIEVISGADTVYDTAAWNALTSGYGWIRIQTEFADDESFDQDIKLKRILNPFSVLLDPNSIEMDGSDADYAFVYDDLDTEEFKFLYPKANAESWDTDARDQKWCTDKKIRIAEYFYKSYTEKTLVQTDLGVMTAEDARARDIPTGGMPRRKARIPTVKWCKLSGNEVLEETEWLGKYIPLVPVYGEEAFHEGRRKMYSLIHQAKDPQSRFNFWLTATTELIALQPRAPYIGLKGAFRSASNKWANANNDNFPFLEYDPVELPDGTYSVTPPQRQQAPQGSAAMFQELLAAKDGVKSTLGVFNASLGQRDNETSGKAILARQSEGDNATFHFVDNLSKSIRHVGRILIDLIPKIYSGARIARIIGEDGTEDNVPINQPFAVVNKKRVPLKPGYQQAGFFKLDVGKYDVVVSTGPSYATKRQESANAILEMARANPAILDVAGDILIKNLDIPDADIIAKRMQKMNPAMQDDEDPNTAKLQQAAQALQQLQGQLVQMEQALKDKKSAEQGKMAIEMQKLQLEAKKIEIEAQKTAAEIQKMQMETRAQIPAEAIQTIMDAISNLDAQTQDTAQAVDTILSSLDEEQASSEPEQSFMQRIIGRFSQQ